MSVLTLADTAEKVTLALRVKDRDKMIDFYQGLIGFHLKQEENTLAILGVKEDSTQHLWLEESPRAEERFGEEKKLQKATLTVSSVEEISDLYQRLKQASYPIVQVSYDGGVRLAVDDPEENRLEVLATKEENKVENEEQLLALASGNYTELTKDVSFQQVYLNVAAPQKEENFLQDYLGFYLGENEKISSEFVISLHSSDSHAADMDSSDVLGLEIIRFVVTSDTFNSLEAHLTNKEQEFYIDKKKTLLTVYDPAGVEWWFVRNNEQ